MSVKSPDLTAEPSVMEGLEKTNGWAYVTILGDLITALVLLCMSPVPLEA